MVEQWHKKNVKEYGVKMCTEYAAYKRVLSNLQDFDALAHVIACLSHRPAWPLHGLDGQEDSGIQECKAVHQAMQKMKKNAESAKAGGPATCSGFDPDGEGGADPSSGTGSGDDPRKLKKQDSDGDVLLAAASTRAGDPIMSGAIQAAAAERAHVSIHDNMEVFFNEINARVLPDHHCLVVLDTMHSASKITLDCLRMKDRFPANASFLVVLDGRYELCGQVLSRLKASEPKRPAYVVQTLAGEAQGNSNQSKLLVYCPSRGQANLPALVNVSPCRRKPLEQVRLQCTDRRCPLNPRTFDDEEQVALDFETHMDDKETPDEGLDFSESEEDDDDQAIRDIDAVAEPTGGKPMAVTLWPPTTLPVAYYMKIMLLG